MPLNSDFQLHGFYNQSHTNSLSSKVSSHDIILDSRGWVTGKVFPAGLGVTLLHCSFLLASSLAN